jgi:uncharacterized membrane protein
MHTIEKSIEVKAPIETVYNQWTQFEEFPRFMKGVEQVQQLDDKRLRFVATIAGKREEWDAEIFEQVPEEKISWRSITGVMNEGTVFFDKLPNGRTQIRAVIAVDPDSMMEKFGTALGIPDSRVKGDLERFKDFIENRGIETGAWRGEIHGGKISRDDL